MPGFQVTSLDRIPIIPDSETGTDWLPVRGHLGVGAFGINAWRAGAGQQIIEPHDEADDDGLGHQELYLVLSGRARFTVAGQEVDAPAGTLVFVEDPSLHRVAHAQEDGTTVLSVGAEVGKVFEPSAWELSALGRR